MPALEPHPPLQFDESGTPLSSLYGDVFRSRAGAWDEARAVFIDGCGLHERWLGAGAQTDGAAAGSADSGTASAGAFTILELGFGLGVNFLSTLSAWRESTARGGAAAAGGRLHYVSVEAHPLSAPDLRRGLAALGVRGIDIAAQRLAASWPLPLPGLHQIDFPADAATLTLAFGDAAQMLPSLRLAAGAIYLDGFAPSRNPQMWTAALMKALARLALPGARLATYSSAPQVRQALHEAGFDVELLPGHGNKRRRLVATYAPRWRTFAAPAAAPSWPARRAVVVGAGLAGAAVAAGFASRGWQVTVLEHGAQAGGGGSAQPLVAEHPHLSPDDNLLARLSRFALLRRRAAEVRDASSSAQLPGTPELVRPLGRIELDADEAEMATRHSMLARLRFPAEFVRALSRDEASDLAGRPLPRGGLWFPGVDAVDPAVAIAAWLGIGRTAVSGGQRPGASDAAPGLIELRCNASVQRLQRCGDTWHLLDATGRVLAEAPLVVLANAGDAARLASLASVPMQRLCGQSTRVPQLHAGALRCVLGGAAYAAPLGSDLLVGASFDERPDAAPSSAADFDNLRKLAAMTGGDAEQWLPHARMAGFGERFAALDRMPLIGELPDEAAARRDAAALLRNDRLPLPRAAGLYGAFAFGSRGLLWATLAGELLPALACGEPLPLERELLRAIDPARFVKRMLRGR